MIAFAAAKVAAYGAWQLALPGYKFSFPRDYASHDDYKTEWWYYTGHLTADDGSRYGYELTFFRLGMDVVNGVKNSPWSVREAYLAHFAISDIGQRRFFHRQRLTRAGIDFGGADSKTYHVWNENWSGQAVDGDQQLKAASTEYSIDLNLHSDKSPVIHGENGVSQKASCVGCASHYYSFTRLITGGELVAHGKRMHVNGLSWMDHEFGSNQLTAEQVGWDWYSIQLDDQSELMLYVMRRRAGGFDEHSSGTFVSADGASTHLKLSDYKIKPEGSWHSSVSGATYPMGWRVEIPARHLLLTISPQMENQELNKQNQRDVTYWEGACDVRGSRDGKPITGQAYVEMTGYASTFSKNI
ncbi:MAG TPA: lipocalin-like domain-containing protein [Candidatus Obscuribacterales bacterium]